MVLAVVAALALGVLAIALVKLAGDSGPAPAAITRTITAPGGRDAGTDDARAPPRRPGATTTPGAATRPGHDDTPAPPQRPARDHHDAGGPRPQARSTGPAHGLLRSLTTK